MTFENTNSECKGVVRYLKAILEQIEEWFRHRTDIGSHVHGANFKEAISNGIKKNLNGRWVNCGKQGHLKWILGKALLEPFFFLEIIQREDFSLLGYAEGMAEAGIGVMNADQQG